jgi:hypothetical protein
VPIPISGETIQTDLFIIQIGKGAFQKGVKMGYLVIWLFEKSDGSEGLK